MGRFLLGLALACAAWVVIGVTEFNESYVFANPGIVDAKTSDPMQWSALAVQQHLALSTCLEPFKYGLPTLLAFVFPPFCTLMWEADRGIRKWLNAAGAGLSSIDIIKMMQFNGNNSANGGYDGVGELTCYGLHDLFGMLCLMLFLGRLIWLALCRWSGKA